MRRRADIWDTYKSNPDFRLYDIYHWEAHPDAKHPEPTTLEQRIRHYEDYLQKFPEVTWPGLVEEPSNPVSNLFGLWQDYWGDQTYLVVVDKAGKIAYQNSFPKGIMDIGKIYDDIEAILPNLLDEESTLTSKSSTEGTDMLVLEKRSLRLVNSAVAEIRLIAPNGRVSLTAELYNGEALSLKGLSSGTYMAIIRSENSTKMQRFVLP